VPETLSVCQSHLTPDEGRDHDTNGRTRVRGLQDRQSELSTRQKPSEASKIELQKPLPGSEAIRRVVPDQGGG